MGFVAVPVGAANSTLPALSWTPAATSTHLLPDFFWSTTARPFLAGANVATTAESALSALATFLPGWTMPGRTVIVACCGAASDVWPRAATAVLATSATSATVIGRLSVLVVTRRGVRVGTVCSSRSFRGGWVDLRRRIS